VHRCQRELAALEDDLQQRRGEAIGRLSDTTGVIASIENVRS
jgi:hypothetical protein